MDFKTQAASPEWITRRKQIKTLDNYVCRKCGTDEDLHVHHIYYIRGINYWEYPDVALITLCAKCHLEYHKKVTKLIYLTRKKFNRNVQLAYIRIFMTWLNGNTEIKDNERGTNNVIVRTHTSAYYYDLKNFIICAMNENQSPEELAHNVIVYLRERKQEWKIKMKKWKSNKQN